MTCPTTNARTTTTRASLRDFAIQGAAETGECSGAQSFRATRRTDGMPVLLHKFRPAASLTTPGPLPSGGSPPDFREPFVTTFTDLFVVAGSAYLVEPLPPCTCLSDAWRHVLQKRPEQALTVMTVLIQQMIAITRRLADQGTRHGALDVRNIVLAPTGRFGLLAAHLDCRAGPLWLRRDPQSPARPDAHCMVDVLGSLLDLDAEVASLQNVPLRVPTIVHRRIRSLSYTMRLARLQQKLPARS